MKDMKLNARWRSAKGASDSTKRNRRDRNPEGQDEQQSGCLTRECKKIAWRGRRSERGKGGLEAG